MTCCLLRPEAVNKHMVSLVNIAFANQHMEPSYSLENLYYWYKNMAYKMALHTRGNLGAPSRHGGRKGGSSLKNKEQERARQAELEAMQRKATILNEEWAREEEEEMQRGVDNFLLPSMRKAVTFCAAAGASAADSDATRPTTPVNPVDAETRQALQLKYDQQGAAPTRDMLYFQPSMLGKRKAELLSKYETSQYFTSSIDIVVVDLVRPADPC